VALMHAGKLLALDTIPRLKGTFVPGTVLEVGCRDAARALDALEAVPGVVDAALFGTLLHVVVDRPEIAPRIAAALDSATYSPVTVDPVTPSLEDVFIQSIRSAEEQRTS
jgi:ABC-2 type transport system ATP-binding protein